MNALRQHPAPSQAIGFAVSACDRRLRYLLDASSPSGATSGIRGAARPLTQPNLISSAGSRGQRSLTVSGTGEPDSSVQVVTNLASPEWLALQLTNPPPAPFGFMDAGAGAAPRRFNRMLQSP